MLAPHCPREKWKDKSWFYNLESFLRERTPKKGEKTVKMHICLPSYPFSAASHSLPATYRKADKGFQASKGSKSAATWITGKEKSHITHHQEYCQITWPLNRKWLKNCLTLSKLTIIFQNGNKLTLLIINEVALCKNLYNPTSKMKKTENHMFIWR